MSYADLDRRAEEIAAFLQSLGVARGDLVAVCLHKSAETIAAWFGILKAGGAYVPIDAGCPLPRVLSILKQGRIRFLIADAERSELGKANAVLIWNKPAPGGRSLMDTPQRQLVLPSASDLDIAYVYFTSGSTGTPKGVAISHRAALSYMETAHVMVCGRSDDVIANHASFAFDLAAFDVHYAMHCCATVSLIPETFQLHPSSLFRYLDAQKPSILYTVPSTLNRLAAEVGASGAPVLPSLRALLFAGEEPNMAALRVLRPVFPNATFHHWYGSTEAPLVTSVAFPPGEELPDHLSMGRPVANVDVAIDVDGVRTPLDGRSCRGELLVKGTLVMDGYYNAPSLNQDVFRAASPSESAGKSARWFRTSDLVRVDDNGELFYVGRADRTIKVRGRRVDLGEVESALARAPGVHECGVITHQLTTAEVRVIGFVQGESLEEYLLLEFLRERLPSHMIPDSVVVLQELPHTTTGKIDRVALGLLEVQSDHSSKVQSPRRNAGRELGDVREVVTRSLLDVAGTNMPSGGVDDGDDLVRSGILDSLRFLRLLRKLGEQVGHDIDVSDADPQSFATVAGLVDLVRRQQFRAGSLLDPAELDAAFATVGIRRGDRVMVHASIVEFGLTERGPDMYVDVLRERIGPAGTIVVPTFTFGFCDGAVFDRERTPSEGIGVFAECVRQLPDAHRTSHAIQSLAVVGVGAEEIARIDTPSAYEAGSAFAELPRQDFKILLLGSSPLDISLIHLCEERARVPYRYFKQFTGRVRIDGVEADRTYAFYVRHRGLHPDGSEPRVPMELMRRGQWRQTPLRAGTLATCSAAEFARAADEMLALDPFALLDDAERIRTYVERYGAVTGEMD